MHARLIYPGPEMIDGHIDAPLSAADATAMALLLGVDVSWPWAITVSAYIFERKTIERYLVANLATGETSMCPSELVNADSIHRWNWRVGEKQRRNAEYWEGLQG